MRSCALAATMVVTALVVAASESNASPPSPDWPVFIDGEPVDFEPGHLPAGVSAEAFAAAKAAQEAGSVPATPIETTAAAAQTADTDVASPTSAAPPTTVAPLTLDDVIRAEFAARGADERQQEWAIRIAKCESGTPTGFNVQASSKGNLGLFQINWTAQQTRVRALGYGREQLFEAVPNAKVAADLWAERGERFAGSSGWAVCSRTLGIP